MGIDRKKQQQHSGYLGTREVLGRFEISDDDSGGLRWRIVSNREGLAQTKAYHQLTGDQGYFYRVYNKLQRYVTEGIKWDSIDEYWRDLEAKILRAKRIEDVKIHG